MNPALAFYQQQIDAARCDVAWLQSIKDQAQADFLQLGLPTRHDEDWKYTKLDSFLQRSFSVNTAKHPRQLSCPKQAAALCLDGLIVEADVDNQHWPSGVIVCSLARAVTEYPALVESHLNQLLQHQHGFQALNTAMLQVGVLIYLPKDVHVAQPLRLVHQQHKTGQAVHIRHLIIAEAGSSATIIEDYQGDATQSYFTNTVTEISLAARAQLVHYKIQRESRLSYHVGHLAVKQFQQSQLSSHAFSFGSKLARSDIRIALHEPKASCLINGIYVPRDGQHLDQHTWVSHEVADCDSEQDYKGILFGHSRAVFNGIIHVAPGAQQTRSKQHNKNLLLSEHAEIDTKPQLEIFADDVVCTHGATVGQLDEDAIFYMASRGIERQQALDYLIQAFAADNLRHVTDESVEAQLRALLNEQLGDLA